MYKAKLIEHKGKQRIAVYFANKPDLIERFKKLGGAQWSATLKCWHLPDTIENREKFKLADVLISRLADEGKNILTHNPKLVEGLNPKSANVFIEIKEKRNRDITWTISIKIQSKKEIEDIKKQSITFSKIFSVNAI